MVFYARRTRLSNPRHFRALVGLAERTPILHGLVFVGRRRCRNSRAILSVGGQTSKDRVMLRATSVAAFLIAASLGLAIQAQAAGDGSVIPAPAPGQPLNSDHITSTGKTVPNPGVPQASGTTEFDRTVQKKDEHLQDSICKGC